MKIDPSAFAATLITHFPELKPNLQLSEGLLYCQMSDFRAYTRQAIDRGDFETISRCFAFADLVRARADDEVYNAVHVSYLEDLDFRGTNGQRAMALLTPGLREGWESINSYMEELLKGRWLRKTAPKQGPDG